MEVNDPFKNVKAFLRESDVSSIQNNYRPANGSTPAEAVFNEKVNKLTNLIIILLKRVNTPKTSLHTRTEIAESLLKLKSIFKEIERITKRKNKEAFWRIVEEDFKIQKTYVSLFQKSSRREQ